MLKMKFFLLSCTLLAVFFYKSNLLCRASTTHAPIRKIKTSTNYKFGSFVGLRSTPSVSVQSKEVKLINPTDDMTSLGDMKVSVLGVGSISWFADQKDQRDTISNLINTAVDQNCNLFDTAERYGSGFSEALGGGWGSAEKALSTFTAGDSPLRVATKFTPTPWRRDAKSVVDACKASCERLGVDSIDLYQIHMPDIVQPLRLFGIIDVKDQYYWEGLAECYKEGLVKNVGVSNYGPTLLLKASEYLSRQGVPIASNQINYSLLYRKNGAQTTVDVAKSMGIKTLAYYPLAMGLLTGKHNTAFQGKADTSSTKTSLELSELRSKYQDILPLLTTMEDIARYRNKTLPQVALNWIICKGVIPIPGARNSKQLLDNLGARGWRLTKEEVERLEGVADNLDITFEGAGFKRSGEKFVGYGLEKWYLN